MRLDRISQLTLRRLAARMILTMVFAIAQIPTPWGFRMALEALFGFTALICAGTAMLARERPWAHTLGYWDEGLVFLLLFDVVRLFE
jgi:hypothetical protein